MHFKHLCLMLRNIHEANYSFYEVLPLTILPSPTPSLFHSHSIPQWLQGQSRGYLPLCIYESLTQVLSSSADPNQQAAQEPLESANGTGRKRLP